MEKMGYAAPENEIEPEPDNGKTDEEPAKEEQLKNRNPRAKENQRESEFMKHGVTDGMENPSNGKPSVKKKVEDIKAEQAQKKAEKAPEREKPHTYYQPKWQKKKNKKKGKSR